MPIFMTSEFTWEPKTRSFAAEASDFPPLFNFGPRGTPHSKLTLESSKTGAQVDFLFERTHIDREGDVTHWSYFSKEHACRVVIFND